MCGLMHNQIQQPANNSCELETVIGVAEQELFLTKVRIRHLTQNTIWLFHLCVDDVSGETTKPDA